MKTGDCVFLRGHWKPLMVVEKVYPHLGGNMVVCVWIDEKDNSHGRDFPEACLITRAQRRARQQEETATDLAEPEVTVTFDSKDPALVKQSIETFDKVLAEEADISHGY